MDKATFDMILGPLEQLNKRGKEPGSAEKGEDAPSNVAPGRMLPAR